MVETNHLTNKMKTKIEIIDKIKQDMAHYNSDEFELYVNEAGWEDWMNEYTEANDDEEISEIESEEIIKFQKSIWDEIK